MTEPLSSSIEETAATTFPLLRVCDEMSVTWSALPFEAAQIAEANGGEIRSFADHTELLEFADELGRVIVEGGDPFPEDAEILASRGIALPAGLCHDPADFPLPVDALAHPAVAAVRAVRRQGEHPSGAFWLVARVAPNVLSVHPPIALSEPQSAETIEKLRAAFPGADVRVVDGAGLGLFVVAFAAEEAA